MKAKVSPEAIARELGISVGSVLQKMRRLGLEVVVGQNFAAATTSFEMPKELLTVEESLLVLRDAMKALDQPGLDKTEVLRLRGLIQGCRVY